MLVWPLKQWSCAKSVQLLPRVFLQLLGCETSEIWPSSPSIQIWQSGQISASGIVTWHTRLQHHSNFGLAIQMERWLSQMILWPAWLMRNLSQYGGAGGLSPAKGDLRPLQREGADEWGLKWGPHWGQNTRMCHYPVPLRNIWIGATAYIPCAGSLHRVEFHLRDKIAIPLLTVSK